MKSTKQILVVLSIMLIATSSSFADRIKISKEGGGCNGYDKITEDHNSSTNNHALTCKDPGNEQCVWEYPPKVADYPVTIVEDIEAYVDNLVLNGTTNASFWYQNFGTIYVTISDGQITECQSGNIASYDLEIIFN